MNQLKKFILLFLFPVALCDVAIAQNNYKYTIDLINVKEDKIKVTLIPPQINETTAIFVIPKVIPGSYSLKEYGRFLTDVKGFDSIGSEIKISRKKNIFYIKKDASKLRKIEYWVNDTWDDTNLNNFIFQPDGSNIEEGKNFVLNGHAFFGYFEDYKDIHFEISVTRPVQMYGSTFLKKKSISPIQDVYTTKDYATLADNPIMYCIPDTSSFMVDNTKIVVSSFSNNGLVKSDSLANWLLPLTISLKNFLGKLPVEEYHFIFYFGSDDQLVEIKNAKGLSGYGALEHNYSSFYYLPEKPRGKKVKEMVQDVAAHEFLHILTPLNLHSEEISNFNFRNPQMSKHLWMYEGVTEYFSWLVRVQNNIVSEKAFINEMREKLIGAERFGSFSFTEMSKKVLSPAYQEKYSDVYLKGAIMAMMIDQLIIKKSNGENNLKIVMLKLMNKYGPDKAFSDESFFDEFTALTYPEVGHFINHYIINMEELPLKKYMEWFGYEYIKDKQLDCYYLGFFSYRLNEKSQLEIKNIEHSPSLLEGDLILKINGYTITDSTWSYISDNFLRYNTSPSVISVLIIRDGLNLNLNIHPFSGRNIKPHIFIRSEDSNKTQDMLLEKWLKSSVKLN